MRVAFKMASLAQHPHTALAFFERRLYSELLQLCALHRGTETGIIIYNWGRMQDVCPYIAYSSSYIAKICVPKPLGPAFVGRDLDCS